MAATTETTAPATEATAPALLDEHSLEESAQKEEDIETDSKFEKQREREMEQVDEEDELEDPGVREESDRRGEEDDTDRRRADVAKAQVPRDNEEKLDRRCDDDVSLQEACQPNDLIIEKSLNPPVGAFLQIVEECLVLLSEDEDIDRPHSSDDDKEDDEGIPKVKEMKPIRLPSSAVVKVEKDYWAKDEERWQKRIARRKEKEAIKRELKEAVANTAETEKKMQMLQEELQAEIRRVQEESQKQFRSLQAQFSMLL